MNDTSTVQNEQILPSWLKGITNPISRFIDKQRLTNELESLSDKNLEDLGLCSEDIPAYVDAITSTIDQECCKMICSRMVGDR